MATVKLISDAEAEAIPASQGRSSMTSARNTRIGLSSTMSGAHWQTIQRVLSERGRQVKVGDGCAPGALDPKVREMIYIAVSAANGCSYCVHSHTAAARAKGMSDEEHGELLADHRTGRDDQFACHVSSGAGRSRIPSQRERRTTENRQNKTRCGEPPTAAGSEFRCLETVRSVRLCQHLRPVSPACWAMFWRYSWAKSIGSSISGGKPPLRVASDEDVARERKNHARAFDHDERMHVFLDGTPVIRKRPA